MNPFLVFAVAALGTYLLRASVILLGDRLHMCASIERTIGLVAPAVLSAIVVSSLALKDHQLVRPDLAAVLAVAGAFLAVRRTSNVSMALATGLPIYWLGVFAGLG